MDKQTENEQKNNTPHESGKTSLPIDYEASDIVSSWIFDPFDGEEAAGNQFGRLEMIEEIGRGGSGRVFRMHDPELNRDVAVKILHNGFDIDSQQVQRFQREASLAASLKHPNIVSIHEVGVGSGRRYIIMDLIDGGTLDGLIKSKSQSVRKRVKLFLKAVEATAHAHENGLVHRDIKPQNILISEKEEPLLTDFGLAKQLWDKNSQITDPGWAAGTPHYMSPEQVTEGLQAVDVRSDVYSLGVVLYEVLCGAVPFTGKGQAELFQKIAEINPPLIRKKNPNVDHELSIIVNKCLQKEPSERYGSASALADDLKRWLKSEPILAHPPSIKYLLKKKIAKNKGIFAAVCVGVITAIVLAGWMIQRVRVQRDKVKIERENVAELKKRNAQLELLYPSQMKIHSFRMRFYQPDFKLTLGDEKTLHQLINSIKEKADLKQPYNPAPYLIGQCFELLGNYQKAFEQYKQGIKQNPKDRNCLQNYIRLSVEGELLKESLPTVLASSSNKQEFDILRANLRKIESPAIDFEQDLAFAYLTIVRGKFTDQTFKTLLQKWRGKPFYESLWYLRGLALLKSNPSNAFDSCTEAIRLRPGYCKAYALRSAIKTLNPKLNIGDASNESKDLEKALSINSKDSFAKAAQNLITKRKQ